MRKTEKKNSLFSMLLVASFILFVVSQLVINSILTPLGIKLEELNDEKEYLLEENRVISEGIAKNSSLKVIENLSEKKLELSKNIAQTFIYIQDSRLVANN